MARIAYFQFSNHNPYQRRFYGSVARQGIKVVPLAHQAFRPLRQAHGSDILHLDWLHPFYKSSHKYKSYLKRFMFTHELRRLNCSRLVWTVHNLLSHDSHLSERFERDCIRCVIDRVDAVVGFSEPTIDTLVHEFPEAASKSRFIIPHGHFIDDFAPPIPQDVARQRLGLPRASRIVLFLGSLRTNKGVTDLVEAFEMMDLDSVHLVIAGSHESPEVSRTLDATSANPRISMHRRFIEADEISAFFSAADLVAIPFRSILNSGSVILALSLARCVVVPDCPSLVAQIPAFARFVFPQHDIESLAETLGQTLQKHDLLERGERAREKMRSDCDWSTIGEQAAAMYRQLLA